MHSNNCNESGDVTSDTENSGGYWSFSSDYKFTAKRRSRLGRRKQLSSDDSGAESSKSVTQAFTPRGPNPALKDIVNIIPSNKGNDIEEVEKKLNTSFILGESSTESGSSSTDSRAADCSSVTDRSMSLYDSMPFRTPAKSFFFDDNDYEPFNPLAGILDSPVGAKSIGKPATCFKDSTIMEPTQFYSPLKIIADEKPEENDRENTDSKSTGSCNSEITVLPSTSIGSLTISDDNAKIDLKNPQILKATYNKGALVPRTPECKVVASPQLLAALRNSPLLDQQLFSKNLDRIDVRSALDSFLRTDTKKVKPKAPPAAMKNIFPTEDGSKPAKSMENASSYKFLQRNQEDLFFKKPLTCGPLPGENNKSTTNLASNICSLTRSRENVQSSFPLKNHVSPNKGRPHQFSTGLKISPSGKYLTKLATESKVSSEMHRTPDSPYPLNPNNQRAQDCPSKMSVPPPIISNGASHDSSKEEHQSPSAIPCNGSYNNHQDQASTVKKACPTSESQDFKPLEVQNTDRNHQIMTNSEHVPSSSSTPLNAAIPSHDVVDSKSCNMPPQQICQSQVPPRNVVSKQENCSSNPVQPPVSVSDNIFRAPVAPAPRPATIHQAIEKPPSLEDPRRPQDIYVNGTAYTAISMLGRGGSSVVYQVIHPKTSEMLAVKCVNLKSVDKTIANGYLNEVELLSKLQGLQSVIRMYDYQYIQKQELLYVVMEKGDIDLAKLIKDVSKTKKISMAMVIYYWTEMLNAVKDIHDRGIIHSDLKPSNFLLVSGRLKLIDFGIASSLQGDTTSVLKDVMCGTFNYMSPEAIASTNDARRTHKISLKSDVWSLGCILYNLVYGRTPYSHLPNMWSKLTAIGDVSCPVLYPSEESIGDLEIPVCIAVALRWSLNKAVKARPTVKQLLELPYSSPPAYLPLASKINSDIYASIMSMFPECNVNLEINPK